MSEVLRVRLTGRAQRFVNLLQDFGHLDEETTNELYIALAELAGQPTERAVDLPLVRRVAAAVIFGQADGELLRDLDTGALGEDWPLLFS